MLLLLVCVDAYSSASVAGREEGKIRLEWARRVRSAQTRAKTWVESAAREALHIVQVEAVRDARVDVEGGTGEAPYSYP